MKACVVDSGTGNLRSLGNALALLEVPFEVRTEPPGPAADVLVLPGVGSFGHAMGRLDASGWAPFLRGWARDGGAIVGICLGLQLLFGASEESPGVRGLGLLAGEVRRLSGRKAKVPHMGWARLEGAAEGSPEFRLAWAYFVHSYAASPADPSIVSAWARHGEIFPAAVRKGPLAGVQFHPEKSQREGVCFLGALLAEVAP
ncbi:MAG: imidazole glycerol phosphate synthase subunit HisH [Acidobacteriota bacterium]